MMPPKKRTTGSTATRSSRRKQESENQNVSEVQNHEEELRTDAPHSSPRKRARKAAENTNLATAEFDILQDEPMGNVDPPELGATGSSNVPEKSDKSAETQILPPESELKRDTVTFTSGKPSEAAIGVSMDVDSVTDEVSHKLENVEMENASDPVPATPSQRRSTRSKAKTPAKDVNMADELATSVASEPRRSGRSRKANPIYDEDKYIDTAQRLLQKSPTSSRTTAKNTTSQTPNTKGVWSAEHLLTSKKSKIINAEANMIFNENTWGLFTDEEKAELLSLLHPVDSEVTFPEDENGNPPPRIPTPILFQNLNNDAFRSAFAELQDDLATGAYDPAYIKEGHEALEKRLGAMADKVDDIKNKEFEEYWGQKQTVFSGDAGEAANVTLYELLQNRLFKEGDMFEYKRSFQGGPTVEKIVRLEEVKLLEDSPGVRKKKDACTLTFRCPPGAKKFLSERYEESNSDEQMQDASGEPVASEAVEDITLKVHTLAQLDFAILDEDGTVKASDPEKYKKYPAGNSWRFFMVRRNDEYLGSPFMIRQTYYEKVASK